MQNCQTRSKSKLIYTFIIGLMNQENSNHSDKSSIYASDVKNRQRPSLFPLRNSAKRKNSIRDSFNIFNPHHDYNQTASDSKKSYQEQDDPKLQTSEDIQFEFKSPAHFQVSSPRTPRSTSTSRRVPKQYEFDTPYVPFVHQQITRQTWKSEQIIVEDAQIQKKQSQAPHPEDFFENPEGAQAQGDKICESEDVEFNQQPEKVECCQQEQALKQFPCQEIQIKNSKSDKQFIPQNHASLDNLQNSSPSIVPQSVQMQNTEIQSSRLNNTQAKSVTLSSVQTPKIEHPSAIAELSQNSTPSKSQKLTKRREKNKIYVVHELLITPTTKILSKSEPFIGVRVSPTKIKKVNQQMSTQNVEQDSKQIQTSQYPSLSLTTAHNFKNDRMFIPKNLIENACQYQRSSMGIFSQIFSYAIFNEKKFQSFGTQFECQVAEKGIQTGQQKKLKISQQHCAKFDVKYGYQEYLENKFNNFMELIQLKFKKREEEQQLKFQEEKQKYMQPTKVYADSSCQYDLKETYHRPSLKRVSIYDPRVSEDTISTEQVIIQEKPSQRKSYKARASIKRQIIQDQNEKDTSKSSKSPKKSRPKREQIEDGTSEFLPEQNEKRKSKRKTGKTPNKKKKSKR